ncbi:GtrA family protein [Lysobacter pythonis]|uniref:GtrA family protein n=1 Tax=Solilutibacter pythonis TaxID=2483112 RepID=A0A3M2HYV7_9GAMM|nr:GtrA family protein [Lysobacter pythonis]RMH92840.1 GtrA family protein [Lysobacter pythonis]
MSLRRHAGGYLLVGGIQWLLDWGVMVLLSHLWLSVAHANIAGRISGALLGYWLNGRYTFADGDTEIGRVQFARFLAMWIGTTFVSTWAVTRVDDYFGIAWAWLAKPVVEIALGVAGFVLSRHWIYKRKPPAGA